MFLDPDLLGEGVGEGPMGRKVIVYRETGSTNDLVLAMGEAGEAEGIAVFAERQTAGRGQFRRAWHSADGLGLWFSVLVRVGLGEPTNLTRYAAVCVAEAIESCADVKVHIKEPNDIYGRGGKVAGLLIETRLGGANPFAVIGIGLNVLHRKEDFPEEIASTASSLALEGGSGLDRVVVGRTILQRMNARHAGLAGDAEGIRTLYEGRIRRALEVGENVRSAILAGES